MGFFYIEPRQNSKILKEFGDSEKGAKEAFAWALQPGKPYTPPTGFDGISAACGGAGRAFDRPSIA